MDLKDLTIKDAREKLKNREFSALELAEASLKSINDKDGEVHAFLEVFSNVLEQAKLADEKIANGVDSPLLGVPIAVKDNMLVSGEVASAGSRILANFRAPADGTAVKKLREAGAVIVGRTNMDEFAMGSSTESSAFGPTRNPLDLERVPGGSSGGSAAALAGGMVLGAFGSDTGGSIRQPASFCGLVGLKPTYGRVSRSGLIALGSSLDQIGPFAKSVSDAELLLEAVSGQDPLDSTSINESTYPYKPGLKKRIGVPRAFVEREGIDKSVKENFAQAIKRFESLGYEVVDIELPHIKYSLAVYYILMPAEASSNLARFDGVKYGLHRDGESVIEDYFRTRGEGFGAEAKRRIILGTYVLSSGYYDEYYGSALKMKSLITREMRQVFEQVDAILLPTTPAPAWRFGEKADPLSMYLADIFTVPANVSGVPAISLPSGMDGRLPLGIELFSDLGREDILFALGREFMGE